MSDDPTKPTGLINSAPTPSASSSKPEEEDDPKEAAREHAIYSLTTVYADIYTLSWWKGHIRIAFGEESVSENEYWRSAVVMQSRDVKRLIKSLQRALERIEPAPIPASTPLSEKDAPGS